MCLEDGDHGRVTPKRMPLYNDEAFGGALITFTVVCAVVNLAVIVSFVHSRKYRKNYHLAYLNLAVSDIVLALFGFTVRGPGLLWTVFVVDRVFCGPGLLWARFVDLTIVL